MCKIPDILSGPWTQASSTPADACSCEGQPHANDNRYSAVRLFPQANITNNSQTTRIQGCSSRTYTPISPSEKVEKGEPPPQILQKSGREIHRKTKLILVVFLNRSVSRFWAPSPCGTNVKVNGRFTWVPKVITGVAKIFRRVQSFEVCTEVRIDSSPSSQPCEENDGDEQQQRYAAAGRADAQWSRRSRNAGYSPAR